MLIFQGLRHLLEDAHAALTAILVEPLIRLTAGAALGLLTKVPCAGACGHVPRGTARPRVILETIMILPP